MARNRLSSDIFSPLRSDISLNDEAFSFGSLSGTPDKKDFISPATRCIIDKDSDLSFLCKKTMKETTNAFDRIVNDVKKLSDIHAEKEEKHKESYEMLQHSMDEVFYKTDLNFSMLSPLSNDTELGKLETKPIADRKEESFQNLEILRKLSFSESELDSKVLNKKCEMLKKNSVPLNKKNKNELKSIYPKTLSPDHINIEPPESCKPKISNSKTSLKKNKEKGAVSKELHTKNEAKKNPTVKDFKFKSESKIQVANILPVTENESLSIEKRIQLAIGMEMDKIRSFILDQNTSLRKEIIHLKDVSRKQLEVTNYLFTVIDDLLEKNKQLLKKCK